MSVNENYSSLKLIHTSSAGLGVPSISRRPSEANRLRVMMSVLLMPDALPYEFMSMSLSRRYTQNASRGPI